MIEGETVFLPEARQEPVEVGRPDVERPGRRISALWATFALYSAMRRHGFDVDIVAPDAPLEGYRMVAVPRLPILPDSFAERLAHFDGPVIIGPRTDSRDAEFTIPPELPPGPLQALFPAQVVRSQSLRPGLGADCAGGGRIERWLDELEGEAIPEIAAASGEVAVWRHGRVRYLASWPEDALADRLVQAAAGDAGLAADRLPEGVRTRSAGGRRFSFNYRAQPVTIEGVGELPAAGVAF